MNPKHLLVLVPLLLAGCAQSAPVAPAAEEVPRKTVTVASRLEVTDAAGRRVQAVVEAWKKADIHHAVLTLYKMPGKTKLTSLTVSQANLDHSVKFADLSYMTGYEVEARAFADASEAVAIDNYDVVATSCTTAFQTTDNDLLDVGVLKLRLRDKVFSGKGTSSGVGVTDGEVHDTTATPGIELNLN